MNDGHPISQPYSRAGLLAKLTGAAILAAGSFLVGQGTSQLLSTGTGLTYSGGTLTVAAVSGATAISLGSNSGGSSAIASAYGSLIRHRQYGYSNAYQAVQVGDSTRGVGFGIDPNTVAGGAFNGTSIDFFFPRGVVFRTPNSAGTDWCPVMRIIGGYDAAADANAPLTINMSVIEVRGTAGGTPGAGQIFLGGGHIKNGGEIRAGAAFFPGFRSAYLTGEDTGAQYQSDGSAWSGTPFAAQYGWTLFQSRSSSYSGSRGFGFISGSSPATIAIIYDNGCLRIGATAASAATAGAAGSLQSDGAITAGGVIATNGGQVTIQGVSSPFIVFSDGTRASYVEQVGGHLRFTPPADREVHFIGGTSPGTPGATDVRFGAGEIKAGAGITCATLTANFESDSILVGRYLGGYLGYTGIRQDATNHDFHIEVYNGGAFIDALKIAQNGSATFAKKISANGAAASSTMTGATLPDLVTWLQTFIA